MDFRALPPQRRQGIGRSHAGPDTRFGKRRSDRFAIFYQSLQLLGETDRSFHLGFAFSALTRPSAPQQSCQACAEKAERADAKGAIGKSWMQGWRITCRVCGARLTNEDDPQWLKSALSDFRTIGIRLLTAKACSKSMRRRPLRPGRRRFQSQLFYVCHAGRLQGNYPTAIEFPGC